MSANNLGGVVEKFTSRLDKIIETQTVTADLNMNGDLLGELSGNGKIKVAKIAMDGLADHTRGGGFVPGGVKLDWEIMQLEFERDREFSIDVLDDEERMKIVSASVMGEFARTKVVPEVDAIRFARLSQYAGETAAEDFTDPAKALAALELAEDCMQDNGKELSQCLLYCTSAFKRLLVRSQPYRLGQGEAPNRKFETFDDLRIRPVPVDRFHTAVTLLDGKTSGEEDGGFKPAEDGKALNFIVMAPEAAAAITKHEKLRYFPPDVNQKDDAHLWQYRLFHDLLTYENRRRLIYASHAA